MRRKKINSHMTIETRKVIESRLNERKTITEISTILKNRDRSNISREIDKHKIMQIPTSFNGSSACINKNTCNKKCYKCEENCNSFEFTICPKLKTSPHVCNGCESRIHCRQVKFYYNAEEAQKQYENKLSNSREGMHYTEYELNVINNDFYCLVLNTRSIYHSLIVINKRDFNFKKSTIYRQIKEGNLRLKYSDLPRSNRKKEPKEIDKTQKRNIASHTYEDYVICKTDNPNFIEWQMDCVQGIMGKNEPVILTLQIVKIKFIFIFKLDSQTANKVLEKLKEVTSIKQIKKIIDILLTDNGHEFLRLNELQEILSNTNIFYCHPYSGNEKGSIENNHELIRRIIPKGVSLKPYTQDDYNKIANNINSLYREELDCKCPFDLIHDYLDNETLSKLGYQKINDVDVMLIPELLGEKNIENIKKYLDNRAIKNSNIRFLK